jgi:hypothetical protein
LELDLPEVPKQNSTRSMREIHVSFALPDTILEGGYQSLRLTGVLGGMVCWATHARSESKSVPAALDRVIAGSQQLKAINRGEEDVLIMW